jgi:hypothetical protein
MMRRTSAWVFVAILGVVAVGSGCIYPRAAIGTGAVGLIVGGVVVSAVSSEPPPCENEPIDPGGVCAIGAVASAGISAAGYLLGGVLLTTGAALVISGLVGLSQDSQPPAGTRPATRAAPRQPIAPVVEVEVPAAPPDDGALQPRTPDQLGVQLAIAARAGHCEAAAAIAHRLAKIDAARVFALGAHDPNIARCLAHRM